MSGYCDAQAHGQPLCSAQCAQCIGEEGLAELRAENARLREAFRMAAQSLADAEREAARKAWDAARVWSHPRPPLGTLDWNDARDRYLAREHPAPAPREVVKCALCRQSGADLSTGTHATRDECIEALGKAIATTEGAR